MKLIIQIPCYNEEDTLAATLADLPTAVEGFDEVEVLVVNDGSTDGTLGLARELLVDHIVDLGTNKGLARAWSTGLETALRLGADVIVNTDGDNQYRGADVAELVRPILARQADMVIGARPIEDIGHFSWLKKRLQRLGSWFVSRLAGFDVQDAVSGFRAYSADAARELNLLSDYSHCTETLIRAARRGISVRSVPVRVNSKLRESRLMSSLIGYLIRQGRDICRIATMVHPLKVFGVPAALLLLAGTAGCARFLVYYFRGAGEGHVQSLIFSAMFIMVAFVLAMMGLAADMISSNHQLIEDALTRVKRIDEESGRSCLRVEHPRREAAAGRGAEAVVL